MPQKVDVALYRRRLRKVFHEWEALAGDDQFDALVVNVGPNDGAKQYKSQAFSVWLTGFFFTETVFVFLRTGEVLVLASAKKVQVLDGAKDGKHTLLTRAVDNAPAFADLLARIAEAGPRVATLLTPDQPEGEFGLAWHKALTEKLGAAQPPVAANPFVSRLLAVKDADELLDIERACHYAARLAKEVVQKCEGAIEADKGDETHKQLAKTARAKLKSDTVAQELKTLGVNLEEVEPWFSTLESEFGAKSCRPQGQPSQDTPLDPGCFVVHTCAKHGEYFGAVARTFFLDPHKKALKTYDAAVKLFDCVQKALKPGVTFASVYDATVALCNKDYPHLEQHLLEDVGFLTGVELRDACRGVLKADNERRVEEGMVFQTRVALTDLVGWLRTEKKAAYCVYLLDTVLVTNAGAKVLTPKPPRSRGSAVYFMDLEEKKVLEEPDEKPRKQRTYEAEEVVATRLRDRTGRDEERKERETVEKRQMEFRERKMKEIEERFAGDAAGPRQQAAKKKYAEYQAYGSVAAMPEGLLSNRVAVDTKAECVLLPIHGQVVPVNLSQVKTVPRPHEDGGSWVLRLNFTFPGVAGGGGAELFPQLDPKSQVYVKEMNFRCRDRRQLEDVATKIKDTQKQMQQKKVEQKQKEECKEQPALVQSKDPKKPKLRDCFVRPHSTAQRGKRVQGTLTAEDNGFRFESSTREKIDIIYSNIKNAIYKDCDQDHVVCVHLNLKSPIMIGKKQTNDVQFYYDFFSLADEADMKGSRHDDDEIAAEQKERLRIAKYNDAYLDFCKDVEKSVWVPRGIQHEFDIPHRGFMFSGVANKGQVDILPGNLVLCALNEMPFFVLCLDDVDIVVFERAQVGGRLQTFDLSFVFKDYNRTPHTITTVSTKDADSLRTYFTEIGLVVFDCETNMTWPKMMKEINKDLKRFADDGGWEAYFHGHSSGGEEEESEPEESAYSEESSDEESSEDSGSDYADSETEDDEEVSDDEEGLDWDEIEEKARKDDKEADVKRKAEEQSGSRAKRRRA